MRKFAAVLAVVPFMLLAAPAAGAATVHGGKQIFCKIGYHRDRDGDRCLPVISWQPHHNHHHHGR